MVISDAVKTILYVSKVVSGSVHDFQLLKDNFPPHLPWFKDKNLYVDSGYQGLESTYEVKAVIIPFKRKKTDVINATLQEIKRAFNKRVSQLRIRIEHVIGGIKIYRMIAQTIRSKSLQAVDRVLEVCAGIWNYKLFLKRQ